MSTNTGPRQQPGAAMRPGQMTMAMRAMPQATGPKVLRIGKVQGGRVIEERVIKQRTHVTIGSSHTNMFLASGPGVPESMRLFELIEGQYVVNLTEAMTGRVALPTGITDIAQARSNGSAKRVGPHYQLKLTEDARGKVVIGDTTFLFQFVAPPPIQPKPQLPLAVKGGMTAQIDWGFTIIAAFSFLVHFGFAGAVNSDWFDPEINEEGSVASLIESAAHRDVTLPAEVPPADKADDKGTQKADDKGKEKADDKGKKAPAGGGAAASKGAAGAGLAKQGAALSSELDSIGLSAITSVSGQGPAVANVMKPGSSSADTSLDGIASKSGGVDTSGGMKGTGTPGGTAYIPGGAKGSITGLGGTAGTGTAGPGGPGGNDKSSEVKIPVAVESTGAAAGATNVPDADSVIARNRWRFHACYTKALASDSTAGGTVRVTVHVDEGGNASGSIASSDAPAGLAACVAASFGSMKFTAPDGGSATFTVPVVLSAKKG